MSLLRSGYGAVELDSDVAALDPPGDMELFRVRPYKETPGFDAATAFVRGVASGDGAFSVEPWFDERRVKFIVGAQSRGAVEDVVNSHFPNSVIEKPAGVLPSTDPDDYAAGARLRLALDCAYPTRHAESADGFDTDPYQSVLPKLIGRDTDRALFQVSARPVDKWAGRGLMGADTYRIGENRGKGRLVGQTNPTVVKTQADAKIKRDIQDQPPRPAFQTTIRVLAFSDDPDAAVERAKAVADVLEEEYKHISEQRFEATPLQGDRLRKEIQAAAQRTIPRRSLIRRLLRGPGSVLTDRQLAALAHLPNESVNIPDADWSRMKSGPGAPPASEQFDYDPDDGAEVPQ